MLASYVDHRVSQPMGGGWRLAIAHAEVQHIGTRAIITWEQDE
jgi:hypothetical protein